MSDWWAGFLLGVPCRVSLVTLVVVFFLTRGGPPELTCCLCDSPARSFVQRGGPLVPVCTTHADWFLEFPERYNPFLRDGLLVRGGTRSPGEKL